jgi:hypothetical protein
MADTQTDYKRRAQTHCKRGHPLSGDNLRLSRLGYRECRTCRRAYLAKWNRTGRAKGKLRCGYTKSVINNVGPERLEAAFDAARETGRMTSVHVAVGSKDKWRAIRHFYPKIAKIMDKIIVEAQPAIIRAPSVIRVSNDTFDAIAAAVPRHLPSDLRDDAIQNIWVAVCEGRVNRNEIAVRAKEFIRAEYRTNHNAWGARSLDVPLWIDSNTTLLDTLASGSSGLWD